MLLVVVSFPVLAAATPSPAQDILIDFSWDGIPACKTLSRSPHMAVRNFPKEAKTVVLSLAQGARQRGGQEVSLPASAEMAPLPRWARVIRAVIGGPQHSSHPRSKFLVKLMQRGHTQVIESLYQFIFEIAPMLPHMAIFPGIYGQSDIPRIEPSLLASQANVFLLQTPDRGVRVLQSPDR